MLFGRQLAKLLLGLLGSAAVAIMGRLFKQQFYDKPVTKNDKAALRAMSAIGHLKNPNLVIKEQDMAQLEDKEQGIVKQIGRENADLCVLAILLYRFKNPHYTYDENTRVVSINGVEFTLATAKEITDVEWFHQIDSIAEFASIYEKLINDGEI